MTESRFAAPEHVSDLRGDDPGERHRGRALVERAASVHGHTRAPARHPVRPEECGEPERRLSEPQETIGAEQPAAAQEPLGPGARRGVHDAALWPLRSQGERREEIGAQIDREDLHHRER